MPAPTVRDPDLLWLRDTVRWQDDPICQYVTLHNPEGLTIPEVSQVLGLAPSNISRDQSSAARKLRALACHPELGRVARAWADLADGYGGTEALQSQARTLVLNTIRVSPQPLTARHIRSHTGMRRGDVYAVLRDVRAVGLVDMLSVGREKRYMLRVGTTSSASTQNA